MTDAVHPDRWQHEPVSIGSPAAGQGFTYTLPKTCVAVVRSVSFTLVNAAAAGSRIPRLEFLTNEGAVFASVAAPFTTGNAVTSRFTFAVGIQQFGANDAAAIGAPIPKYVLEDGAAVRVAIAAVNVADQVSGVFAFVDQLPIRPDA